MAARALHEPAAMHSGKLTPLLREAAQTAEAGCVAPQEAPEHEAG